LDHLTSSTIIIQNDQDQINHIDNLSLIDNEEEEEEESILPNLFHQSIPSTQEKLFYSTFMIPIENSQNIFLYTMTLSTVQLSASILLPYSILNGRRPLIKSSDHTHFKQIRSKQKRSTHQVTAIESCLNIDQLQQNDILLKVKNSFSISKNRFSFFLID
jgi:hypothetical protein